MYNTARRLHFQHFFVKSYSGIREIFPTKAQVSRGFSITTITFNRGYTSAFISIISLQEENILTIGLFFPQKCVFFAPALTILVAPIQFIQVSLLNSHSALSHPAFSVYIICLLTLNHHLSETDSRKEDLFAFSVFNRREFLQI